MYAALLALYRRRSYVSVTLGVQYARAKFVKATLDVAYPYSQRKYVTLDGKHRCTIPFVVLDVPIYGATGAVALSVKYVAKEVISTISLDSRYVVRNFTTIPMHIYYSAASGGFAQLFVRYQKRSLFGIGLQSRYVAFVYKGYHLIGLYTYKAREKTSTQPSVALDVVVLEEVHRIKNVQPLLLQSLLSMSGTVNVDAFVSDPFLLRNESSLERAIIYSGPHELMMAHMVDVAEESIALLKFKVPIRTDIEPFYFAYLMSAVRRPMLDFYGPRMTLRVTRRIKSYRYTDESTTIGICLPAVKIKKPSYTIDSPGVYRLDRANRFYILALKKEQSRSVTIEDTAYSLWLKSLYFIANSLLLVAKNIVEMSIQGGLRTVSSTMPNLYDLPERQKVTSPFLPCNVFSMDLFFSMAIDSVVVPCRQPYGVWCMESSSFVSAVYVGAFASDAAYNMQSLQTADIIGGYVSVSLLHGECIACAPWHLFAGMPLFIPTKHVAYVFVDAEYVQGILVADKNIETTHTSALYYAGVLHIRPQYESAALMYPLTLYVNIGRSAHPLYHGPHLQKGLNKKDVTSLRFMFYFIIRSGTVPTIYSEPIELEVTYG